MKSVVNLFEVLAKKHSQLQELYLDQLNGVSVESFDHISALQSLEVVELGYLRALGNKKAWEQLKNLPRVKVFRGFSMSFVLSEIVPHWNDVETLETSRYKESPEGFK